MADEVNLGPESLLGTADEDAQTLRDRLDLALRYLANWYKATASSNDKEIWWVKIDQVRAKVELAYNSFTPADKFPGKTGAALYNDAALAFPQLWRELYFSRDTLPEPDLLDVAAGVIDAGLEMPGYVIHKIGKSLADGVGGAAGALVERLWPYALLVGLGFGVYFFRGSIRRAFGKVAA